MKYSRSRLACTSLFLYLLGGYASSPSVKVELRSSWPAPPILLECIETVSIEETKAFFPLLDVLTDPERQPDPLPETPEATHQHVINTAVSEGFLSRPGDYSMAEMNLALHAATPKIEAFYQYYSDRHAARVNQTQTEECGSWVDWYGQVVCDVETLKRLAGVETLDPSDASSADPLYVRPKLMPYDHVHPPLAHQLEVPPRTAILYAYLSSKNFRELHAYLYSASSAPFPHIEYVFRPIPSDGHDASKRIYLTGYGVALDLKKMDYLALDDRRQGSNEDEANSDETTSTITDSDPVMALLQQYPQNSDVDMSSPLTEDELHEIGLQATQLIYDSDERLSALKQLTQNFPKYTAALARRVIISEELQEEVANNQVKAAPGMSMMWLNGVALQEKDLNPFGLLRLLRKERETMLALTSLGLSPPQAVELLTHPIISDVQSQSDVLDGIFDASDRPEGGNVIVWFNDLEKDSRYARWGTSLNMLLRPMYPGQFPNIKANVFNAILVVDLSQTSSIQFISATVSNIINRNFPFRWGVVPIVETEEGARMARLLYFLDAHFDRIKIMEFLRHISQADRPMGATKPTVDWNLIRAAFDALVASRDTLKEVVTNLDAILDGSADFAAPHLEKARAYTARLDATLASAPQGYAFVNGKHFNLDDTFLRAMQIAFSEAMEHLQGQIVAGILSDHDVSRISTYFYDLPSAAKRRNAHIYPSGKINDLRIYSLPDLMGNSGFPSSPGSFVYPPEPLRPLTTTYLVADFDSGNGLRLIKEAVTAIATIYPSRIAFVHSSAAKSNSISSARPPISSILAQLTMKGILARVSPSRLLDVLGLGDVVPPNHSPQVVISPEGNLDELFGGTILEDKEYDDYMKACRRIVKQLELAAGDQALVVNGRLLAHIEPGDFLAEDFNILSSYESRKRIQPVADALEDILGPLGDLDRGSFADLISLASSVMSAIQLPDPSEVGLFNAPYKPRQRRYQLLDGEYTAFNIGDNNTALYHFGVVIDPLSEAAQRWSSLMEWLSNIPSVFIELHINPPAYRELPLKRFYRYSLLTQPVFDDNGDEIQAMTKFTGLPIEPIYTLAMDVPQSWLVRPREALHDLDNILLGALSMPDRAQGVKAVFDLDYLVVEGHARDVFTNAPPRGVQLQLVTNSGTSIADTQVVANLGYLQFRTKPGVFHLEIRPGRGREIFRMESVGNEGWNSPSVDEVGDEITLTSFEGLTLYPRLARLPGKERADVLAEDMTLQKGSTSLLDDLLEWLSSLFHTDTRSTELTVSGHGQADINIFTVASGLLYERFASIMILSVLRNTNSSVKFWFIENFLSPSFLEFIPHFAEAYGFQYELVTYKWPSWLRAQREKQRIIWAYKILFLDVLFPMDLKKVIFVDADQIVRTDLKDLVDLDLHGAPYGYTPMGDDNVEMEGFRFWKTGYWKDFLRGLPYHISALYVVDLVRFRQIAAGDILRGHYQQLSADPNSLANLDQDLPNNLQREVPIFSLPEDWLWCETWCSKDRLHRAKTIDLCQNPLTKEPKLARARQIPEWEEYDGEIARFARRLSEEGKMRSGIVAADVNVLADVGAARLPSDASKEAVTEEDGYPRDEL